MVAISECTAAVLCTFHVHKRGCHVITLETDHAAIWDLLACNAACLRYADRHVPTFRLLTEVLEQFPRGVSKES